ncbi:GntR family transcriptional regulator [Chitinispirillum alkaliphilum]|nr:GntR family transcriptional regulator [Chitinispirillum alkaliphilum]
MNRVPNRVSSACTNVLQYEPVINYFLYYLHKLSARKVIMVKFSSSAQNMRSSEIRRLMKLAADPSIISFAGGMPANSLFPVEMVDNICNSLSREEKQRAMQYCPTEGYPPLVKEIKEYLVSKGFDLSGQELIVTTGAQQAISVMGKVMLDPGDVVITEFPSFIGALAAFKSYGAVTVGASMDSEGIIISELEELLEKYGEKVKMVYLNPYFHNPAGIIYSESRKKALIELLKNKDICLLEDDPYGELYFDSKDQFLTRPMKTLLKDDSVPICYAGSLAKIFGPGIRLGWLLAPAQIADKCQLAKQSMDACSSTYTQVLAAKFFSEKKLQEYLTTLRPVYARRAQIMLDGLEKNMPEGVKWTTPKGGFYVWVTLPENINSSDVFNKSIEGGAAFVVGSAFDPEGERNNCFRLAFSHTPEDKIADGVRIVADAVRACM